MIRVHAPYTRFRLRRAREAYRTDRYRIRLPFRQQQRLRLTVEWRRVRLRAFLRQAAEGI